MPNLKGGRRGPQNRSLSAGFIATSVTMRLDPKQLEEDLRSPDDSTTSQKSNNSDGGRDRD